MQQILSNSCCKDLSIKSSLQGKKHRVEFVRECFLSAKRKADVNVLSANEKLWMYVYHHVEIKTQKLCV